MFGWCDGLDVEPDCYEWFLNPITREPKIPKRDIAAIKAKLLEPQDEDDGWVLHNPKYDVEAMESLPQWGDFQWPWSRTFDTLLALHLIRSNEPHDLTSGVLKYVGVDIQPFEDRMHEAVLEARKIATKKFPEWCIAKKGAPGMPSAKEKVWKFDMWLPRQIAAELNYPDDHPWWRVTREYNGADVGTGLALFHVMRDLLKARDLWEIYLERLKLPRIVVKTERKGVTLSADRMAELEDTYRAESAICHDRCVEIAGDFGVELKMPKSGNSKSLLEAAGAVLYSRIGTNCVKPDKVVSVDLPQDEEEEWHHQGSQSQERVKKGQACTFGKFTIYLTPTRNLALSKDVVKSYLSQEGLLPEGSPQREWFENLLAKRKRDTALTYMKGYRNYWLPMGIYNAKGEQAWYLMHPSLNSTGTDTLRWSSSNPNEQNISKQEGFNLRYMFGPAPGREWWSLDYENVELRIPAYESGEQAMIDIFEKPDEPPYWGSYHLMNASIVYPDLFYEKVCSACLGKKCKPSKPCGKLERLCDIEDGFKSKYKATWYQYIKNFGFAVGYGAVAESGTADRAAHKVGAQLLVQSRLKKHAALNQSMIDMANRLGYVETIPDRTVNPRRGYPLYVGRTQWGKAKPTTPLNYHVQGTAMQAMAKAMVRTDDYLETKFPDGHIVMQVHDELVFDFPAGKGPKPYLTNLPKIRAIRRLMEQSGEDIGIPLRVAVSYHPNNWSEEIKL